MNHEEVMKLLSNYPIKGLRYNVIRRPLSGGKHSISQHKPSKSNPEGESAEDFYNRLGGLIASEPEYFFMRWQVEVTPSEIARFKNECLTPTLEQLCDWWQVVGEGQDGKAKVWSGVNSIHWRTPYGLRNPMADGGTTALDEYLHSGSEVGLTRGNPLFQELTDA